MSSMTLAAPFRPVAAEAPGGGRIRDKHDPAPGDLVTVRGFNGRSVQLHRLAAQAWTALVEAARAAGLREPLLLPVSGYRSSARQARLYRDALRRYGTPERARKWVAPPGASAHQSGRAIDFYLGGRNKSSNVAALRQTPAYLWLASHAGTFGFYPYLAEPWHWEYNPPASRAAPAAGSAGPVSPAAAGAFLKQTREPDRYRLLVPILDRYRGDIPLEFLLGWIAVESSGRMDVVTRPPLDERGFFQVSRDESAQLKLDHARLTTDPDYSVQAGIQLVRRYARLARARYPWAEPGSELFWRMVKLQHAMGGPLTRRLVSSMQQGHLPMTWEAIKRYEVSDGPRLHRLLNPRDAARRGRFTQNVDKVFRLGRQLAARYRR